MSVPNTECTGRPNAANEILKKLADEQTRAEFEEIEGEVQEAFERAGLRKPQKRKRP